MEQSKSKKDIINKLQKEILLLQGFKPAPVGSKGIGLGPIEAAFPNSVFPTAAIHEMLITVPEHAAACGGFLAGLLNILMKNNGVCLWISRSRSLFPAALKVFGVEPDQIIFIDLKHEKDVLWVMEEALKCAGLAAVVGELKDISFTQSRRLQLSLEKSKVTGFILRTDAERIATTACVARWQITPIKSEQVDGLPGLGFPRWNVELLRVRNGNPGLWKIEWSDGKFQAINDNNHLFNQKRKIG
jgi:protein ImuA